MEKVVLDCFEKCGQNIDVVYYNENIQNMSKVINVKRLPSFINI